MRNIPFLIVLPSLTIGIAGVIEKVHAEDYLTNQQAQQTLFPNAEQFIDSTVMLSENQLAEIQKMAGVRQRQKTQRVWRAEKNNELLGWVLIDDVIGKHDYITYGVAISPDGKILGVEILSYRETHGGQIRNQQWRNHFVGKTLNDPFKLNKDIPNISGATLSSRNVTDGIKRLLVIYQIALKK